jgi:hypothetical protein
MNAIEFSANGRLPAVPGGRGTAFYAGVNFRREGSSLDSAGSMIM